MTDEPLIPMSDAEIAFCVRMALGLDGRGRMGRPGRGEDSWEVQAQRVVDYFRRSRVRVFRSPPPPIPADHVGRSRPPRND